MATLVVYAVNSSGGREILAIEPMYNESKETWGALFKQLKVRGLKDICLIVSDAHLGIQSAVAEEFVGTTWQRCKVHFMRNILAHVTHREKKKFSEQLKLIWTQPDKESALNYAAQFAEEYRKRFPAAIEILESGIEDSLSFYDYPMIDKRRISSTNTLERFNREIRRRSRVVGVFPSRKSYIRLITSYIIEYSEDWEVERNYINPDFLKEAILLFKEQFNLLMKSVA